MKRKVQFSARFSIIEFLLSFIILFGSSVLLRAAGDEDFDNPPTPTLSTQLEEMILEASSTNKKVNLDLFVMSHCPYGLDAERAIIPYVKEHADIVNLNIYYIANETENGEFESMHGSAEVEEDIRQLIIKQLYPDQYLDYILQRAEQFYTADWVDIAERLEIDAEKVKLFLDKEESKNLFENNIKFSWLKEVDGSPTLFVDNSEYTFSYFKNSKSGKEEKPFFKIGDKCKPGEGPKYIWIKKDIGPMTFYDGKCYYPWKYRLEICEKQSDGSWRWDRGGKGITDREVTCPPPYTKTYKFIECRNNKWRRIAFDVTFQGGKCIKFKSKRTRWHTSCPAPKGRRGSLEMGRKYLKSKCKSTRKEEMVTNDEGKSILILDDDTSLVEENNEGTFDNNSVGFSDFLMDKIEENDNIEKEPSKSFSKTNNNPIPNNSEQCMRCRKCKKQKKKNGTSCDGLDGDPCRIYECIDGKCKFIMEIYPGDPCTTKDGKDGVYDSKCDCIAPEPIDPGSSGGN